MGKRDESGVGWRESHGEMYQGRGKEGGEKRK